MDEAPIDKVEAPKKTAGKTEPKETIKTPDQKTTSISATTKNDLKLYLKSGHKSPKWNEFIEPGFQAFEAENLATASIFLQKAHDMGCRDPLVLFRLAIFKESKGNASTAADLLVEAAKNIPSKYPSHPLAKSINKHAARALYSAERYNEALPYLDEALNHEPDDFMLLFMSGMILEQQGAHERARAVLERAVTIPPPPEVGMGVVRPLLIGLIQSTFAMGDLIACEAFAAKLAELYPGDPIAAAYRKKLGAAKMKAQEQEIIKKFGY